MDICGQQLEFSRMSPPRVGALRRTEWNKRCSAQVTKIRTQDMPIVMDVDEIHTPEYEPTTMHIEEEQNLSQKAEHMEEDTERTKFDASRGKGM
jgi:hypothetical protein